MIHPYDPLAHEYYDAILHPTCSNFRDASRIVVAESLEYWLRNVASRSRWLDVGAGKSLAAEILRDFHHVEYFLIAVDESMEMLGHTPKSVNLDRVVTAAGALPFAPESLHAAVVSLGDPFNTAGFWHELHRVLALGSPVCFTTPSFEWTDSYRLREGSPTDVARFTLESGDVLNVPSYVYPSYRQAMMFKEAGFELVRLREIELNEIPGPLSPKLLGGQNILTGYELHRL